MKILLKIAAALGICGLVLVLATGLITGKTSLTAEETGIHINSGNDGFGMSIGRHWFGLGRNRMMFYDNDDHDYDDEDRSSQSGMMTRRDEGSYTLIDQSFDSIRGLDIDADLGDVRIVRNTSAATRVTVNYRNCQTADVKVEKGILKVEVEHPRHMNNHSSSHDQTLIVVYVGTGLTLEDSEIELALGDLTIENIDFLRSKIELALGDLTMTGRLHDNCKIEMSLGDIDLTLLGERSDYRMDVRNSLGDIQIGDVYKSEMENSYKDNTGTHYLKIENSLGETTVDFQQ